MAYIRTHDATFMAPPDPVVDGVIYTCPMHPQIRQVGPGSCPICGMTLEPVKATAEVGENNELIGMTRRFWVGFVLTLPVFVLEMGGHIPTLGLHELVPARISIWIQFALSTPVVLWAGWPFFERAWASVIHSSLNMFSLIALGTGAAYLYSLFATFAPGMSKRRECSADYIPDYPRQFSGTENDLSDNERKASSRIAIYSMGSHDEIKIVLTQEIRVEEGQSQADAILLSDVGRAGAKSRQAL
jgi:Heavy metal binding domain